MQRAFRLGLTGGIGSGKSTVAQSLAALGAWVIDADAVSRQLTAPGGGAIAAIAAEFGSDFITSLGALDREKMRALSFSDPAARARLEAILHPRIGQTIAQQTEAAVAAQARCIVFDVPLLVESKRWRQQVDRTLVVDCAEETQITRVMARSGIARDAVLAIVSAQATRARRVAAADFVLSNDAISLTQLHTEVTQIWEWFALSSRTCGG
jgi:dephospho-CoA kinase